MDQGYFKRRISVFVADERFFKLQSHVIIRIIKSNLFGEEAKKYEAVRVIALRS